MKAHHTLLGSIALLLVSLAILGICVSPSTASGTSWNTWNGTVMHGHTTGYHFAPNSTRQHYAFNSTQQTAITEKFITNLQNQGVDVSAVQADLANNDTAAVTAWFHSYMTSYQGSGWKGTHFQRGGSRFSGNATGQQVRIQSMITKLQSQGVDTSSVQAALSNNDTASVRAWFTTYFQSHAGSLNMTTRHPWHQWNTTAAQNS